MKRAVLMGVSAIALAGTGPAVAADFKSLPVKAPVATPSWAGGYVGIVAGGTFGNSNHFIDQPVFSGPTTVDGCNIGGGLVGGTVGYNFQTGPWVYGVEGDLSFVDAQGGVNDALPVFNPLSFVDTRGRWLGTGRGRLGWSTPDNVLLYATGGFAVAGVEAAITHPNAELRETNVRWGWTVGAGAEDDARPALVGQGRISVRQPAGRVVLSAGGAAAIHSPQRRSARPARLPLRARLSFRRRAAGAGRSPDVYKAPVAVPSWAGLYLGVEAGGGSATATRSTTVRAASGPPRTDIGSRGRSRAGPSVTTFNRARGSTASKATRLGRPARPGRRDCALSHHLGGRDARALARRRTRPPWAGPRRRTCCSTRRATRGRGRRGDRHAGRRQLHPDQYPLGMDRRSRRRSDAGARVVGQGRISLRQPARIVLFHAAAGRRPQQAQRRPG